MDQNLPEVMVLKSDMLSYRIINLTFPNWNSKVLLKLERSKLQMYCMWHVYLICDIISVNHNFHTQISFGLMQQHVGLAYCFLILNLMHLFLSIPDVLLFVWTCHSFQWIIHQVCNDTLNHNTICITIRCTWYDTNDTFQSLACICWCQKCQCCYVTYFLSVARGSIDSFVCLCVCL